MLPGGKKLRSDDPNFKSMEQIRWVLCDPADPSNSSRNRQVRRCRAFNVVQLFTLPKGTPRLRLNDSTVT